MRRFIFKGPQKLGVVCPSGKNRGIWEAYIINYIEYYRTPGTLKPFVKRSLIKRVRDCGSPWLACGWWMERATNWCTMYRNMRSAKYKFQFVWCALINWWNVMMRGWHLIFAFKHQNWYNKHTTKHPLDLYLNNKYVINLILDGSWFVFC